VVNASLYPRKRYLMLFPVLGTSSLPVVVAQPNEKHANRTPSVLEWYKTDTEIAFKNRN